MRTIQIFVNGQQVSDYLETDAPTLEELTPMRPFIFGDGRRWTFTRRMYRIGEWKQWLVGMVSTWDKRLEILETLKLT